MARDYKLKGFVPDSAGTPPPPGRSTRSCGRSTGRNAPPSVPGAVGTIPAEGPGPGLVNGAISEENQNFRKSKTTADFLKYCYDQAPITGFRIHRNDVETIRHARNPDELAERLVGCERGKIEHLSAKSRRRLALVAGNCGVAFRSFVTVTYPKEFPCDGHLVKRHLHSLLSGLRWKTGGCQYLWFLEFQRRGAPHFHVFIDFELPGPLEPMQRKSGRVRKEVQVNWAFQDWLSNRWFGIVGSGDEKHRLAGASWEVVEKPDGAARYVSKESYKTHQKQVPEDFQNVGRFWGTSRGVSLGEGSEITVSLTEMQKRLPASCFDSDGIPFPVVFGAAGDVRKMVAEIKAERNVQRKRKCKPTQANLTL